MRKVVSPILRIDGRLFTRESRFSKRAEAEKHAKLRRSQGMRARVFRGYGVDLVTRKPKQFYYVYLAGGRR